MKKYEYNNENYLLPIGKNMIQNSCGRALSLRVGIQTRFLLDHVTNFPYHALTFFFC